MLREALHPQSVVLDTGSGPGSWVLQDERARIGFLVGEDVYRPDTQNLDAFVLARAEQLPFVDASLDVVFSYLVLEHLEQPELAFHEYARVLKPGGHFIFKTPAVQTPLFLLAKLLPTSVHRRLKSEIGTAEEDIFPTYYRANTVARIERALASAGLEKRALYKVDQTYAYMKHNAILYALGLLYSRATEWQPLASLRNQIVGAYRRPETLS